MKIVIILLKQLFTFSLVFYLILFLLETLFPGFVSDVFSLNWVLGGVLILGIISAFLPEDEDQTEQDNQNNKPAIFDYVFAVALGIIGATLIFWKVKLDNEYLHWLISALSGLLIMFMGVIVLIMPDQDEEAEIIVESEADWKYQIKNLNFKKLLVSKIQLPVSFVVIFILLTSLFIIQKPKTKLVVQNINPVTPIPNVSETPTPTQKELPPVDPALKIFVINGGAEKGEAKRIASIFTKKGYKNVEAKDSPKQDYKDTIIEFTAAESAQADIVEDVMMEQYFIVNRSPLATDSAQINVILGAQAMPEDDSLPNPDENFDFFFN
ncbi:MAG: LytR C-terminal domain-containing protein [Candidatus Shapirobacteria bacterium]|nr:LytR C-terminal domain-containing protein [Candidatus Shapirobacteria bacterium]